MQDPEKIIHFIGIGGSGMSPLAEISLKKGLNVTGSDSNQSDVTKRLENLGAKITIGHSPSNVPKKAKVIFSSAISSNNPEIQQAKRFQSKILHRSDYLAELMVGKKAITIAGTHGKTTTTAIISHILEKLGQKPTAAIGGQFCHSSQSSIYNDGEFFVAETDESDGTLGKYKPFIGILTDVDIDHLDHFESFEHIKDEFHRYLQNIDNEGCAIVFWDNEASREVGLRYNRNRVAFGKKIGCDARILSYKSEGGQLSFRIIVGKSQYSGTVPLFGYHNALNCTAALSVINFLGLDISKSIESLKSFPGVYRRQNLLYNS